MGRRIRGFDWSTTSLGPPDKWPQSLKTSIRIMLMSRQPVWIGWGPELLFFFNDPYFSILGGKQTWALGRPTREVWNEIWTIIGPMLATAMSGDEGTYVESQLLIMERNGYPEETYYTFSYSPIPDDEGLPGGIICANTEDTQRVIGQRELSLLRDLAAEASRSQSAEETCARSVNALAGDPWDFPLALIYLSEPGKSLLRLRGSYGISAGHRLAPDLLRPDEEPFRIGDATKAQVPLVLEQNLDPEGLSCGAWTAPPTHLVILPFSVGSESVRTGALIVGANRYRLLDANHLGFLSLVAGQIGAAIADAEAAEQERRRLERMAELDRAKTTFFTNVSHEFRTPLTLMLGPIEEMVAGDLGPVPEPLRRDLDIVRRNGRRLQRLVNTLLDFARLEAGRAHAIFRPTDVASLTADIASGFRSLAERAGLRLTTDCPKLPAERRPYIDRDLWEKVILNLVSNAFKHTFEGEIRVSTRERCGALRIVVEDTGTGIPAHELPTIFERFRRVDGAQARSHEGSGIGLALVHEIVRLHGGEIYVASRVEGPRRGTRFAILLPEDPSRLPPDQLRREAEAPERRDYAPILEEAAGWLADAPIETVAEMPASEPNRPARVPGARLLIADDNADMRGYLARILGNSYVIELAEDGEAALEAVRREVPDLLVTDVMMPRRDGFSLVSAIRSDERTALLPIIMLSARAGEEARVEGLDSGADDYLVKPFTARELLARVDSAVALSRMRREAREKAEEHARELEANVKLRTAELQEANEQLEGFTYSVAHDLRQNIRGIGMNASIVLEDAGDLVDARARERLNRLVYGARQLGQLVDDLLQYAKLGKAFLKPERVELSQVTQDVIRVLERAGACPPASRFVVNDSPPVQGDYSLLRMVVENLIGNACKYTAPNRDPVIEFGYESEAFYVRDNGQGFDMAFVDKLFMPFERLHNDDARGGTGIGLANVRRIVEKHGGRVWAVGEPERGATFRFTLPLSK